MMRLLQSAIRRWCPPPIYCGEYSKQQILWVMAGNYAVSQGEYTGAELRQMMEWLVNVRTTAQTPSGTGIICP